MLDWELCTLGDPLADLGQLLVYWPEPGEFSALGHSATTAPGFPTRAEMAARYEAATGRDLGTWTSTWRSLTGSWPASWRACTPATWPVPWVTTVSTSAVYPTSIAWLAAQARQAMPPLS